MRDIRVLVATATESEHGLTIGLNLSVRTEDGERHVRTKDFELPPGKELCCMSCWMEECLAVVLDVHDAFTWSHRCHPTCVEDQEETQDA